MGEVIPRSTVSWTVLASACLHAGAALLLLSRMQSSPSVVPIGIEMIYMGEAKRAATTFSAPIAKTAVKTSATANPEVVRPKSQVEPSSVPSSVASTPAGLTGPAGQRDGAIVSAIERYKYDLRLFLESRKIYPETAKRLRQTGKVVVHFKVSTDGRLSEISLEQASTSEILNRAAMDLVTGAPQFKPLPSDAHLTELQLSLPIEYVL